ncbi:hypothetical protein BPAE_0100g00120 [Botrytis paeoniae]|uniref:Uncharacterized protein n=1 Tax=Botrytis paeoniae TaxID=278948 RepID=A0A4Z1FI85_9HELO|nr:hypothetical protein BPAE_0100g00120 [Botrytis paeoniae]
MSDDKHLIEVLSLKKALRPATAIDTNYVKDGKLVYEMFVRNIESRDISPRLAGQVEAIIEVSNDILKKSNRLFRGTLRRRKLYKQLELLEGGLQKLVDGIKVADEGVKEVKRLQVAHAQEKQTYQEEKVEQDRKITETEKEIRRMEGVQAEEIRKQAVQRILLNYGDYVADRCLMYKQSAEWDRKYSAKYWSEIHEIIELEKEIKAEARSLFQAPPPTPMLNHLTRVALDLKVPMADILWDISMYSERNKFCHTDIAIMVKQGNWMKLAQRTQIDYENVDVLLPDEHKDWALPLKSAIKQFQEKYFSQLRIERTLHSTGGFEIRDYKLNTEVDDTRKAKEEATVEVALDRKKKAEDRRKLKVEKKRAGRELRASKDLERVSSTGTVLQYRDSAVGMDESSLELDGSLLSDLF